MPTYGSSEGVRGILRRSVVWTAIESKGGVTPEEINPHIDRAESVIRARIGRYYRFPLNNLGTDADSQLVWPYPMADIIQYLAASYLVDDKFGETEPNQTTIGITFLKRAERLISQIINGEIILQGNRRFAGNLFTNGEVEPLLTTKKAESVPPES